MCIREINKIYQAWKEKLKRIDIAVDDLGESSQLILAVASHLMQKENCDLANDIKSPLNSEWITPQEFSERHLYISSNTVTYYCRNTFGPNLAIQLDDRWYIYEPAAHEFFSKSSIYRNRIKRMQESKK